MFGHVQANLDDLPQEEKKRYHAAYCGLCRALGERHGFRARLGLTFDLTFLTLLLSSLYEPPSGEIESLLFCLQAAAGAGVVGFVLGRLTAKKPRNDEESDDK